MQNPPVDNLGYRFSRTVIVELYMSPSSRSIDNLSMGVFGIVSSNQPFKKITLSSNNPYLAKFLWTSSCDTARHSASWSKSPLSEVNYNCEKPNTTACVGFESTDLYYIFEICICVENILWDLFANHS